MFGILCSACDINLMSAVPALKSCVPVAARMSLTKGAMPVEAHFLGQYLPWDSHQNAKVAMDAGMLAALPCGANWWPAENLDNAQTSVHDFVGWLKYGYGRGCAQISVDVRAGAITRTMALEWVRSNDGLFPEVYAGVPVGEVLDRIGMTRRDLYRVMDQFTDWSLFRRVIDDEAAMPMLMDWGT